MGKMHGPMKCTDSKKRKFGTDNKKISFSEVDHYSCDNCGASFASKKILNNHLKHCLTHKVDINDSRGPNITNKPEDSEVPIRVSKLCFK